MQPFLHTAGATTAPLTLERRCDPLVPRRRRPIPSAGPSALDEARCGRDCRLALEIASAFFAVPKTEIGRPTRAGATACEARHVAMYLAHVIFQVPLREAAAEFGRDRTSVAYGVGRIEDRRDEKSFDETMERLERLAHAVRSLIEPAGATRPEGNER